MICVSLQPLIVSVTHAVTLFGGVPMAYTTLPFPCVLPKFEPVIVICPPGAAADGLMLLTVGGPTTVKFTTLLEPAVVITCDVAAPTGVVDGIQKQIRVSPTQEGLATAVPFSNTELLPCVAPNAFPSRHC